VIKMPGIFDEVTEIIRQIEDDKSVPKNVVVKLHEICAILNNEDEDRYIRIDKALQQLENITDDTNLQPFIRTKIWNISSILESL